MIVWLLIAALLSPAVPIRVLVLALHPHSSRDARLAAELTRSLRRVVSQMQGVEILELEEFDEKTRTQLENIIERCGREADCQQKIGTRIGARIVISGSAGDLGTGATVDLEVLDVGSGKSMGRITRSMSGSSVRRAAVLEAVITRIVFPERMVGSMDLFLDPPGARIFMDGRLKLDQAGPQVHLKGIRAGQHTVRIEKDGYADFYAIVQVPFMGTTKLKVDMRPARPGEGPAGPVELETEEDTRWYERWWVWAIIGIVATGATASTIILTK